MRISIQNTIDNINEQQSATIIKSYTADIVPNGQDCITAISVKLLLDGGYDYDDTLIEEWKLLFHAYKYYISIKQNRLYLTFIIKV